MKLLENLMSISARAGGFISSDILVGLRSCRKVAEVIQPLVWRCYYIIIAPWFPGDRGYKVLGCTASQLQEMSREVFSLSSVFFNM